MAHTDLLAADEDRVVAPATRAKVLAVVAIGPVLTGYAAVAAVLALVTAIAARAHFSTGGVLTAAVPGWLAAYQVPVRIDGHELGALPLLPTVLVMVLVWRAAAGAAERLEISTLREAGRVVLTVAGAHAVVGLALALLVSGGPVTVDPLAGLYYPALLAALAAIAGVLPASGVWALVSARVDPLALRGIRAGALAVVALLAVGGAVLVLALVLSFGTVKQLFLGDGAGSAIGMLLLSLGYLPNAVVAATGFAAGPGFSLGSVTVSPLDFAGGPVPALPLLGALPERGQLWWWLLLLLPAAVGVLVGWVLRDADESPRGRLRAVSVAAVVVALAFAVLGGSAGGALGGGPFHPLDLRAAWVSLAVVVWVALPGAIVAWTQGPQPVLEIVEPEVVVEPEEDDESEEAEEAEEAEEPAGVEDAEATEAEPEADGEPADDEASDPEPESGPGAPSKID
ncbi:DUF6350 family protein [Actinokineospora sp. NBRC 105648]|uniref:cell division protein PerM n=1 Tax=Actinokineospora sp. NBRC 105648 TaxID=3032206 RepID=UPI0024A239E6|nr:DUF6350 family protein [Actinokineospora sp. NBRC 105648]GLZ43262.1 hypothetical protein Acsp05_68860 [Actinokineospora sp. NBRC 105648]